MAGESVAAPAGVAAEGAFEGLLASVQFDVSQQVSLLGEWDAALVALEWPVAWERKAAEVNTTHTFERCHYTTHLFLILVLYFRSTTELCRTYFELVTSVCIFIIQKQNKAKF